MLRTGSEEKSHLYTKNTYHYIAKLTRGYVELVSERCTTTSQAV